jgi:hypothetical protein
MSVGVEMTIAAFVSGAFIALAAWCTCVNGQESGPLPSGSALPVRIGHPSSPYQPRAVGVVYDNLTGTFQNNGSPTHLGTSSMILEDINFTPGPWSGADNRLITEVVFGCAVLNTAVGTEDYLLVFWDEDDVNLRGATGDGTPAVRPGAIPLGVTRAEVDGQAFGFYWQFTLSLTGLPGGGISVPNGDASVWVQAAWVNDGFVPADGNGDGTPDWWNLSGGIYAGCASNTSRSHVFASASLLAERDNPAIVGSTSVSYGRDVSNAQMCGHIRRIIGDSCAPAAMGNFEHRTIASSPQRGYMFLVRGELRNSTRVERPAAPVILASGTCAAPGPILNTPTPVLTWGASGGATRYGLYISVAPYGTANIIYANENVPVGTSFQLPPGVLNYSTRYRWNMVAKNAAGESSVSNTLYFQSPCPAGFIADCNGNCAPATWATDNWCDDGRYFWNGQRIYFNCPQFNSDAGACGNAPPPIQIPPRPPVQRRDFADLLAPGPNQNGLVLITHGWNTRPNDISDDWEPFRQALVEALTLRPNWAVRLYDWNSDSGGVYPGQLADWARSMAKIKGSDVGAKIVLQGYDYVHLIAHSAGSALIAEAARVIKQHRPNVKVHTTFLDAYAGTGEYEDLYGGNSDWSDHYYTAEWDTSGALSCPGDTRLCLPECFNVEISGLRPLGGDCYFSHGWPRCFYLDSVLGESRGGCEVPSGGIGAILGYGFELSFERWTGAGGYDGWLTERNANHPKRTYRTLPVGGDSGCDVSQRVELPIVPPSVPYVVSSVNAVQVTGDGIEMTTRPPSATTVSPSWINLQLETASPSDHVAFTVDFTGTAGAEGLLTLYVNNEDCGAVDERLRGVVSRSFVLPTPSVLQAGSHLISFRFDPFNDVGSSVTISNLATGYLRRAARCTSDFNGDGDFGTDADIEAFFACLSGSCCGTCNPHGSDFNDDGDFGTDADIESFFRVLAGGPC